MDGMIFPRAQLKQGISQPPFHPNCRCTTVPYDEDWEYKGQRIAKDKEGKYYYVPENMSYEEWKREFVEGSNVNAENFNSLAKQVVKSQEEANVIAQKADKICSDETNQPSRWSGKVKLLKADEMPTALGRKEWNCDIVLREDADLHIAIHEHLHARSISFFDPATYIENRNVEEGTVEFFSQEICKKHGINFVGVYPKQVQIIKAISELTDTYQSNFEFAKALFETPLTERYDWILNEANHISQVQNLSDEKTNKFLSFIYQLYGDDNG